MQTYFYTFPVSWAHCQSIDIPLGKIMAPSCRDEDLTFLERESILAVILFTVQKCSKSIICYPFVPDLKSLERLKYVFILAKQLTFI